MTSIAAMGVLLIVIVAFMFERRRVYVLQVPPEPCDARTVYVVLDAQRVVCAVNHQGYILCHGEANDVGAWLAEQFARKDLSEKEREAFPYDRVDCGRGSELLADGIYCELDEELYDLFREAYNKPPQINTWP